MSVYAKVALGLCALGVLLMVGVFTALLWEGGEEVSSVTGSSGGSEKTGARSGPPTTVEEKAMAGEMAPETGDAAGQEKEAAARPAPEELPYYEMLREREAEGLRQIDVKTQAREEEQMRLIAEDLRSYAPKDRVLLLEFDRDADATDGTGFAMVFDSRVAVADPSLSYTEEEEEAIFEEDGGIRVVSYKEPGEGDQNTVDEAENLLSNL